MSFDYTWYDIVGNVGVFFIVYAFLMLQLNKMSSSQPAYSLLNAVGAGLILVSLVYDFNLSAFVIELFWILISLVGIIRYYISRSQA